MTKNCEEIIPYKFSYTGRSTFINQKLTIKKEKKLLRSIFRKIIQHCSKIIIDYLKLKVVVTRHIIYATREKRNGNIKRERIREYTLFKYIRE